MSDDGVARALMDMAYTAGVAHRACGGGRPVTWDEAIERIDRGENLRQVWNCRVYAVGFDTGWCAEHQARRAGGGMSARSAGFVHRAAVDAYKRRIAEARAALEQELLAATEQE